MPPRRPASPAVVVSLAAVGALIAGAAGAGAYLGVTEYLRSRPAASGPGGGGTETTGAPTTTTTTAAAEPCPTFTVAAVKLAGRPGELTTVIYVKGELQGNAGAEAWICRDSDGTLYYQGHELSGPATEATSRSTLLLGGPIQGTVVVEGDTYRAYPDETPGYHYEVSPDSFAKVQANGNRQDYEVVEVRP